MIEPPATRTIPIEVHASTQRPMGMPAAQFLADYWQKRPLLVRRAFPDFQPPLSADELGGLACEEAVLSRLIRHDPQHDRWTLRNGPLDEALFAELPDHDWTILVEDVDKWDADVAALLQAFAFLPSWRIDDIMVSYAEHGGGVGAHVDHYDVFLLQGLGQRQWAISTDAGAPMDVRDDVELKQLKHFEPTHTWLLEPGDMLYLPPGVAHRGVAVGACMTFSIGMRAPSQAELLLDAAEHLAERLPESRRLADPDLLPAGNAGEMDGAALARVRAALGPLAQTFAAGDLARWFGTFITRYRSAQIAAPPPQPVTATQVQDALRRGATLLRHPWSRLAWTADGEHALLFAAGQTYSLPAALARELCATPPVVPRAWPVDTVAQQALLALINDGHLLVHRDD